MGVPRAGASVRRGRRDKTDESVRIRLGPNTLVAATPALADGGGPSPGTVQGWDGIARGDSRYVAIPTGTETVVQEIARRSGRVVRWALIKGSFGIPLVAFDGTADGLSKDGRTLVLEDVATGPSLQKRSSFAVFEVRRLRLRHMIRLRGDFSFDALSPGGRMLYLTERLSPNDLSKYRVRAYDVGARRLLPAPLADKRFWDSDMYGMPMSRASSRDGAWAYTLYAGGARTFVHALNTTGNAALCIFLPDGWAGGDVSSLRLRLASSNRLLVRHVKGGKPLAVVDVVNFRVLRAVRDL